MLCAMTSKDRLHAAFADLEVIGQGLSRCSRMTTLDNLLYVLVTQPIL